VPAGAAGEAGIGEGEVKTITLGSLFDGIGGFPLAASRYGIKTLWASEIEPFPIKVTKIRLPNMKHLGDITQINGAEIEPVDIITFGSPCQDLSVAGKRAGLAGERSGLFMEAVRIIKEVRNTYEGSDGPIRPRFAVWENVPGAFSSNKGEDFRAVLEEICRIKDETVIIPKPPKGKWSTVGAIMGNGWSIAWRILDAQYWGVPQRRRRIFLVADFGGQSAPEVLFKRQGLSRHLAESRKAREGIAADVKRGIGKAIGVDVYNFTETGNTAATLNATSGNSPTHSGPSVMAIENKDATDLVCSVDCRNFNETEMHGTLQAKENGGHSLNYMGAVRTGYSVRRLTPLECERLQGFPDGWTDIPGQTEATEQELEFWREVWLTWDKLQAEEPEEVKPRNDKRLLKWLKNPVSDSVQYKALGNSVAVPCVEYVLEGIKEALEVANEEATP